MAQVYFDSDTPNIYELDLTANEILSKHVTNEQLADYDLFFNGRKIGKDQKLSDIKGLTNGRKILRILNRKSSRIQAPSNLRQQVVELDKRVEQFHFMEDRHMTTFMYDKNYIKKLINDFPIILEEPILLNVLTDYSLLKAMLHEEVGFIQQHPSYVPIFQKILADALPPAPAFPNFMNNMMNNPPRQRNAVGNNTASAPPRQLFTNQMLHDAIFRTANPPVPVESSSTSSAPTSSPSTGSTASTEPPEAIAIDAPETAASIPVNRYAAQLTQLHDMGFTDDNTNIVILDSVDGNVEQAMDLLFAMRD
uniref:UBA domain-containing protein n=1 Tax=Panagrolaimus sp. PS1159 TaxID=55785 RepID=A0AC35EYN7_9BILA